MRYIPSLQTLRAFEAAGRHQSYSRAAEELGLTHGAISHRIRELEDRLGSKLFDRRANSMTPTPEGHRLLAQVRHALDLLETTFAQAGAKADAMRLMLSVLPSFAARWLVPRLAGFRSLHPQIELEVRAAADLVELGARGVDAAIRFGPGGWPGLSARHLADEVLFPVCAPGYRDRLELGEPADLKRATLLRHAWQPWAPWLRAANVDIGEPTGTPSYPDADLLLRAAAAGEGVALARGLLVADDLNAGRLVRPFNITVSDIYAYYLVWPPERAVHPAREAFETWLLPAIAVNAAAVGH